MYISVLSFGNCANRSDPILDVTGIFLLDTDDTRALPEDLVDTSCKRVRPCPHVLSLLEVEFPILTVPW